MFSPADIDLIMNRVGDFTPPLRSATYVTLIGLLAATGLRIGEAIKLDRADIDWSAGLLLIRESKFGKFRLVPLQTSSMKALTDYGRLREQRKWLLYAVVGETFRRVVDEAGIGADAPPGPGCTTCATPSRSAPCSAGIGRGGRAIEDPVAVDLSRHREPASTYWYLSAVPELLAMAAARQESAWSAVTS